MTSVTPQTRATSYSLKVKSRNVHFVSYEKYMKYLDADKMRGKVGKSELTPLNGCAMGALYNKHQYQII